jgi:hypothetical protein
MFIAEDADLTGHFHEIFFSALMPFKSNYFAWAADQKPYRLGRASYDFVSTVFMTTQDIQAKNIELNGICSLYRGYKPKRCSIIDGPEPPLK